MVVPALSLGNDGDTVALSFGGIEIDRVTYAIAAGWTVPNGAALSLDPLVVLPDQNDFSGSWCPATTPMTGGDLGSPGQPNPSCGPVE